MKNKWIIITVISIILISSAFYVINFWNHKLSTTTETWGAFSDYLNPFIAIANLIIFIWLSTAVYAYNKKRDHQDEIFKKTLERPVLVSKSIWDFPADHAETWNIVNIGNGAALNLIITTKAERNANWRSPSIKCFSLGKKDSISLDWILPVNVICVIYEDIFSHKYVTICADDETYTQPLNENYKTISIENSRFEMADILAILELDQQRLHWARINGPNAFH
jgi:hypothetical protein